MLCDPDDEDDAQQGGYIPECSCCPLDLELDSGDFDNYIVASDIESSDEEDEKVPVVVSADVQNSFPILVVPFLHPLVQLA